MSKCQATITVLYKTWLIIRIDFHQCVPLLGSNYFKLSADRLKSYKERSQPWNTWFQHQHHHPIIPKEWDFGVTVQSISAHVLSVDLTTVMQLWLGLMDPATRVCIIKRMHCLMNQRLVAIIKRCPCKNFVLMCKSNIESYQLWLWAFLV